MDRSLKIQPKITATLFLLTVIIFYNVVPRVYRFYSFYVNIAMLFILLLLWLDKIPRRYIINRTLLMFCCCFVYGLLLSFKGLSFTYKGFVPIIVEVTLMIPIYLALKNYTNRNTIRYFAFFLLFVFMLVSIDGCNALIRFPRASREIAGAIQGEQAIEYLNMGVPSFGYIYFIAFTFYPVLQMIKKSGMLGRMFLSLYLVISGYLLILSKYSMALLVAISFLYLFVIGMFRQKWTRICITVVFAIMVLSFSNGILTWLYALLVSNGMTTQSTKVLQLLNFTNSGEISSITRFHLYQESISLFLSSPFLGADSCGQHSQILDCFAVFGLFGLMFIMFIKGAIKEISCEEDVPTEKVYFAVFWVFIILNTFFSPAQITGIFFVNPILMLSTILEDNEGTV